jgi:activator of HSP90 ATPase
LEVRRLIVNQFEITNYADAKDKQVIRDLVRTKITPQLRKAFAAFPGDLMAEHGKDIQHVPSNDPAAAAKKVAAAPSSSNSAAKDTKSTQSESVHTKGHVVNTVTLTETYEFNTSAEQLYLTFVEPQRVAAFTRAPPLEFEPKEGGKFVLFGGNVEGVFKSLEQNKKIVQSWRLAEWPKGVFGYLRRNSLCANFRRPLLHPYSCLRPGNRLDQP